MAKKRSARGGFNMSEAIRGILTEDPTLSSREVFERLKERYPDQNPNRASANVAFSHARRKLGIKSKRRSVTRAKPSAPRAASTQNVRGQEVNLDLLRSARKLLAEAGSAQVAINAIQQLQSLQLD